MSSEKVRQKTLKDFDYPKTSSPKPKKQVSQTENVVDIRSLIPDPKNARLHPDQNQRAMEQSLKTFGAGRSIVVDKDGIVRAGNGTLEAAKRLGIEKVRIVESSGDELIAVKRPDWTESEAIGYAIADNRAAELAEWNSTNLQEALESLQESDISLDIVGFDDSDLEALIAENENWIENEEIVAEEDPLFENHTKNKLYDLRQDVVFDSSNEWGIPDLKPDRLYDGELPNKIWTGEPVDSLAGYLCVMGKHKLPENVEGGFFSFFTDDVKFEVLWNDFINVGAAMADRGWAGVLEPNYSMWMHRPHAEQLWNLYRSRWLGRYWQELGIDLIPCLGWTDSYTYNFGIAGIPKNCPVVAMQCQTTGGDDFGKKSFIVGLRNALEKIEPGNLLLYGGEKHRSWIEPQLKTDTKIHWLSAWTYTNREQKRGKK